LTDQKKEFCYYTNVWLDFTWSGDAVLTGMEPFLQPRRRA